MRIATSLFSDVIEIEEGYVTSLIIENPNVFMGLLKNIYSSANCNGEDIVLSSDNKVVKGSKYLELITSFVPFDINEKRLLNKIISLLESVAIDENNYSDTMNILAIIERFMNQISEEMSCKLDFSSITITSLIKMCGVRIDDDSFSDIERVFNYMTMVRELLGEKLFVFVNMHSYFDKEEIQQFVNTVNYHKFYVLMLDSDEFGKLEGTNRIIIDKDLCCI